MNEAWYLEKQKNPHTAFNSWCRGYEAGVKAIEQAELAKPEQSTLESKVKAHIKDLQGCVKVLEDYPRFSDTRLEICKAVEELKQALAKHEQD